MNEKKDINKYIEYRITKSNQSLKAARLMIESEFYDEGINRLYYSCFYIVSAFLFKNDIESKTHAGVRNMVHKHLVQTNLISPEAGYFYSVIFDRRQAGDYEDFINYEKDKAEGLLKDTELFLAAVGKLLSH